MRQRLEILSAAGLVGGPFSGGLDGPLVDGEQIVQTVLQLQKLRLKMAEINAGKCRDRFSGLKKVIQIVAVLRVPGPNVVEGGSFSRFGNVPGGDL